MIDSCERRRCSTEVNYLVYLFATQDNSFLFFSSDGAVEVGTDGELWFDWRNAKNPPAANVMAAYVRQNPLQVFLWTIGHLCTPQHSTFKHTLKVTATDTPNTQHTSTNYHSFSHLHGTFCYPQQIRNTRYMTSNHNNPLAQSKGLLKQASGVLHLGTSLNGECEKDISSTSEILPSSMFLASANCQPNRSAPQLENTNNASSMNSPTLRPSPGQIHGSRKRRAFGSNGPLCENGSSSPLIFVQKTPDIRTLQSQHHAAFQSQQSPLYIPSTPTRPDFPRGSPDAVQQKTPSSNLTPSPSPTVEKLAMFEKLAIQSPIIANSPGSSFKVVSSSNSNNTPGSESARSINYPNGARLPLRRDSASPRQVPLTVLSSSSSEKKTSMLLPQSPDRKSSEERLPVPFFSEAKSPSRPYLSPRWKRPDPNLNLNITLPTGQDTGLKVPIKPIQNSGALDREYSKPGHRPPIACDERFMCPEERHSNVPPLHHGPPTEVTCEQDPKNYNTDPYHQSISLFGPSPKMDPRDEFRAFANIPNCNDSLTDSDDDGDWFFLSDPGATSIRNNNLEASRRGKKSKHMVSSVASKPKNMSANIQQLPFDLPFVSKPMMMPTSSSRKDMFLPIATPPQITTVCSGSRLSSCNSLFGMSIIHENPLALEAPSHQHHPERQDGGAFTFGSSGFPSIGIGTAHAVKRSSSESSFGISSNRTSSDISLGLGLEKAPYITDCNSRDMITPPVISTTPQNPPPLKKQNRFTIL